MSLLTIAEVCFLPLVYKYYRCFTVYELQSLCSFYPDLFIYTQPALYKYLDYITIV